MYIITKEKQYYYLTDEKENKQYSLNINTKEIKNEKTNRILKNFPNITRKNLKNDSTLQGTKIESIISEYKYNSSIMFLILKFYDKLTSLYVSVKKDFDINIWQLDYSYNTIRLINENFSKFIEILKIDDFPEDIYSSIQKYPYYSAWKTYKNLINFEDFYCLCLNIGLTEVTDSDLFLFILKAFKKAKFLPHLKDKPYVTQHYKILKQYYQTCFLIGKKPSCENNMLREINETIENYQLFKNKYDKETFKKNYQKHHKAWVFSYNSFIVDIPTEPQDLVLEGQKMHHCVGNYINDVLVNETYIVFIRKENDIKTPYITAQVNLNGQFEQYYLAYDEKITKKIDIEFKERYQEYLNEVWDLE